MRSWRCALWGKILSRGGSSTVCCDCWMRCSRWPIRSCRGGLAVAAGGALRRDGAVIFGAAGRGGAAICGVGRGAMTGRCCGGAGRNAGAAGRAIAGGGAGRAMAGGRAIAGGGAGRAIAGGGAGRAMAGGGATGRTAAAGGPVLFISWADEPALAVTVEMPRRNAVKRMPSASMIVAT
jgi:hypothetical protein